MESQQKHVIHLYEFEQQSINEKQLSKQILDSLKTNLGDKTVQIKIKGRPNKYWAYFQTDPETAAKLSALKQIKIGENKVHIGRYYYDYQIFINKLNKDITQAQVIQYFSQFGDVVDTVITEPADKKIQDFKHCYIKMKDQKTIDRIILARIHKINDKEIRLVRTFGLQEDKESDKKLFLKIEGLPDSQEDFEQNAIEFFMKHGKIRQRPKFEDTKNNLKYKMIVTYTSAKDASNALQAFQTSSLFTDYQKKNIKLSLEYFHTKQNKIYVCGLKELPKAAIKQAFEIFGQVSDISISKSKFNNAISAVIGYSHQNDFKMALAAGTEKPKILSVFIGKPYITIFMTNQQKKSYQENKKKQQTVQQPIRPNYPPMNAFYPPQSDIGYPINPQFRQQGVPMMQPVIGNQNIPPNMMPSNMVPPPNMMPPNMPIPGQFNQQGGNRMFPKQTPPPPRNN